MMKDASDFDFSNLSSAERLLIAEQLLDSMFDHTTTGGFTPEQIEEMEIRMQAADNGSMKRIPWNEARKQLGSLL